MIRRRLLIVAAAAVATAAVMGCAAPPGPAPSTPAGSPPIEWLAVTPRAFDAALAPLVAHRAAQGLRTHVLHVEDLPQADGPQATGAVRRAIEEVAAGGALRFVLLAGDPHDGPAIVPAFIEEPPAMVRGWQEPTFASDHGYAGGGAMPRAVGRLPARDERQLATMVAKILRYEASPGGEWQRRVLVAAGPADFGPVVDALIESEANRLLDERLPQALDLEVMFAQPSSPYAYRLDRFGTRMVDELDEGAFLAVYVGHGEKRALDAVEYRGRRWPIATTWDLDALGPAPGQPLFFALTCSTGAFGQEASRSWAEHLVLHENGPVGVFASAHISFPYPNFLYAEALLAAFTEQRHPTLGEGIVAAKRAMLAASYPLYAALEVLPQKPLKELHLRLYNLFGDPATRLRHPGAARITATVGVGGVVRAVVTAEGPAPATAHVSLETQRHVLRAGRASPAQLEAMPLEEAFEAMQRNHALAVDKVLARAVVPLLAGVGVVSLQRPAAPGTYIVKVLVRPEDATSDVSIGHARLVVE